MKTIQKSRFEELEEIIEEGLRTFIDVGRCFIEIKNSKLYKEKYGTFSDYCDQRWGVSISEADRLMKAFRTEETLKSASIDAVVPTNESQYRKLEGLTDDQKIETWKAAVDTEPDGGITAAHVQATRERLFGKREEKSLDSGFTIVICPDCGHEHECRH